MRFEEGAVISQAIALIMTMRNAAERMRHPSMSYNEEMKAVIEWIVEPK
jgi:AmiR/NasT family two-component response regulator